MKNRFETSETYTPKHFHTRLGWDNFKNQSIFNEISFVVSKYDGEYYVTPKGDYKQWKELIKEELIGNNPLELAVIIGLSAVVNAYVGKQFDFCKFLIYIINKLLYKNYYQNIFYIKNCLIFLYTYDIMKTL